MPRHHEKRVLPHSADSMFDLVADVGRYPEFLPWVTAVRVRSNSERAMVADMVVGFSSLRERFASRVIKEPKRAIHVEYLDGPLKFLRNDWIFAPTSTGCTIDFNVEFAFRSRLFEMVAGQVFDQALRKMIGAFEKRAEALYGAASASGISSSSAHSAA